MPGKDVDGEFEAYVRILDIFSIHLLTAASILQECPVGCICRSQSVGHGPNGGHGFTSSNGFLAPPIHFLVCSVGRSVFVFSFRFNSAAANEATLPLHLLWKRHSTTLRRVLPDNAIGNSRRVPLCSICAAKRYMESCFPFSQYVPFLISSARRSRLA